ncbi:MAG: ATP-binding protein [Clostridiales bacterium]|nr:ATP-binding protein [Clostridiales bacterium]
MITCQANAVINSIPLLCDLTGDFLNGNHISEETGSICMIIIDEIINNISSYAYDGGKGTIFYKLDFDPIRKQIIMTFEDSGSPFDPISQKSPDLDADADDRKIGGLGIYMVKKLASDVRYEYRNGKNVLTVYVSVA